MKSSLHQELEERLSTRETSYVLITCERDFEGGPLEVEMSYGGDDPILASYLLSGAQAVINEEVDEDSET